MTPTSQLSHELAQVLEAHQVEISVPREHMVQLNAVQSGPGHTKPATNVLLSRRSDQAGWEIFVDEDFYFVGEDPARRRLFGVRRHDGWRPLTPPEPLAGDLNHAVLQVLRWLDSPLQGMVPVPQRKAKPPRAPAIDLDPQLERVGRLLDVRQLRARTVEPTGPQAEAVTRACEIVTRSLPPSCPVLYGESGCGKSTVAAMAAEQLLQRGLTRRVLEISGAAVSSGAIFTPQRDEQLRQTLAVAREMNALLVILEQFDLVLGNSDTAESLICESLDQGVKLVAVARPAFSPDRVDRSGPLIRRLEMVRLEEADLAETKAILLRWIQQHRLARQVEVAPEIVTAVLTLSRLRPGVNPGSALGLLEAVLAHAVWNGLEFVTPDDLYYLVPQVNQEED